LESVTIVDVGGRYRTWRIVGPAGFYPVKNIRLRLSGQAWTTHRNGPHWLQVGFRGVLGVRGTRCLTSQSAVISEMHDRVTIPDYKSRIKPHFRLGIHV
jgi:hypothetical protein